MGLRRAAASAAVLLLLLACEEKKPAGVPAVGGAPQASSPAAKVWLGHVAALTGPEAAAGESTERGILLAIEELNARGGVKSKQLDLRSSDDQGRPEEAAAAASRLAGPDRVVVLVGEVSPARSVALAAIAEASRLPMVSPSSSDPEVTKDGGRTRAFVFRAGSTDALQGAVMARFARERGLGKVAILRDVGSAYSLGLADRFLSTFRELGGAIVNDQSYKAGDQDFKAQLTTIRARAPEAIYVPGHPADVALLARQARELGLKVPLLGGDRWDSPALFEKAGSALDGSYYSSAWSAGDPSPRIQGFIERYRARFGAAPDALAAAGHDAVLVAADAVSRAKDLSGEAVAAALAETRGLAGVTGTITLDTDHQAVKPAAVLEVKGGKAVYVATVAPEKVGSGGVAVLPASQPAQR